MLAPASDRSRSTYFSLLRGGFPLVLIDRALPDADCDLIVSDNANGARRLIEHLIGIGHREIAHVTDAEDTSTGRERLRGYRDALDAAGIPFQSELVVRTTVDRIGGYRAAQEILARDPLPNGYFRGQQHDSGWDDGGAARAGPFGPQGHGTRVLRRC